MKQAIQGNVALTLRTSARIPATGPLRAGTIHQPDCPLSCRRCTVASATQASRSGCRTWAARSRGGAGSIMSRSKVCVRRRSVDDQSVRTACNLPHVFRRPIIAPRLSYGPQRLPSIHFPRGLFDRGDDAKCLRAPGDKTDRLSVSAFRH